MPGSGSIVYKAVKRATLESPLLTAEKFMRALLFSVSFVSIHLES
jgi:hypothetical protein